MRLPIIKTTALFLFFSCLSVFGAVTFTQGPSVSVQGNNYLIAFTVSASTDVEVAILDTQGKKVFNSTSLDQYRYNGLDGTPLGRVMFQSGSDRQFWGEIASWQTSSTTVSLPLRRVQSGRLWFRLLWGSKMTWFQEEAHRT